MKNKLLLTLSSLAMLTLASCTPPTGDSSVASADYEGDLSSAASSLISSASDLSGDATSLSSVDPLAGEWAEEDAAKMQSVLSGYVLPYVGDANKDDVRVELDPNDGTLLIDGFMATAEFMEAYDAAIQKMGFRAQSSGYANVYMYGTWMPDDTYMSITMYAQSKGAAAAAGVFHLEARDPFYYEFPEEVVAEAVAKFESNLIPPAFEAEFYEAGSDEDGFFYVIGESDETDAAYKTKLTGAGWEVIDAADANSFNFAISPDEKYSIAFAAYQGQFMMYFQYNIAFPAKTVAAFFEAAGSTAVFPEFNDGRVYLYAAEEGELEIITIVDDYEASLASLDAALVAEDGDFSLFTETEDGVKIYLDNDKKVLVRPWYYATEGYFVIDFMPYDGLTEWPAEIDAAIKAVFGDDATGLPDGLSLFYDYAIADDYEDLYLESGSFYIDFVPMNSDLDAAAEAYGDILDDTFTKVHFRAADYYVAPAGDYAIVIEPDETYGTVTLYFMDAPDFEPAGWDADAIQAALVSTFGEGVSALPNGGDIFNDYELNANYLAYVNYVGYFWFNLFFDGETTTATEAAAAYEALLAETFTPTVEQETDTEGNVQEVTYYTSPDNKYQVVVMTEEDAEFVLLFLLVGEDQTSGDWPAEEMLAYISYYIGESTILPPDGSSIFSSCTFDSDSFELYADYGYLYLGWDCTVEDGDLNKAAADYIALLTAAGFTPNEYEDYYGDTHTQYISPDHVYAIDVTIYSSYNLVTIEISKAPAQVLPGWPANEIAAAMNTSFGASATALPDGAAIFDGVLVQAGDYYGLLTYVMIQTTPVTGKTDAQAVSEYNALLTSNGFTYSYTDDYGDAWYNSPDGSYEICVYVGTSGGVVFEIWQLTGGSGGDSEGTATAWPASNITAFFGEAAANVPGFVADEYIYQSSKENNAFLVAIQLGENDDVSVMINDYIKALYNAGFEFEGRDSYGDYWFVNEQGLEVVAYYQTSEDGSEAYLCFYLTVAPAEEAAE